VNFLKAGCTIGCILSGRCFLLASYLKIENLNAVGCLKNKWQNRL
jgi:hypothetical protein